MTYENAYVLLSDVRKGNNEYSEELLQGTHTHGKFDNTWLMKAINRAQALIHATLMHYAPARFLESVSLTGVSSVYTLPGDFGKLVAFLDENGRKVYPTTVSVLPTNNAEGSDRRYYQKGNTLVLTKSGVTDTHTLWYYKKPRDLHQGKALSGSGADTLVMAAAANMLDDYYNGCVVEDITADFVGTISDYTGSTRTATVTGATAAEDDYYGTVSDLPQAFHKLIAPRATMIVKLEHPAAQRPSASDAQLIMASWAEEFVEALRGFAGSAENVSPEEIWCDFGGGGPGVGVNIPGQGYTIY